MKRSIRIFSVLLFSFIVGVSPRHVSAKSNLTDAFNDLFMIVTLLSVVVLLFVISLWAYFINKYKESNKDVNRDMLSHSFSKKLEVGWTLIATLIIIFLMITSYPYLFNTIDDNEANVLEISGAETTEKIVVEGTSSWTWRFHYNDTIQEPVEDAQGVSYTEMTLDVGKPYTFILWSSGNLIHSFFIRELNFKQDVTPGTNNTFSIIIEEPGSYEIRCAEFCGPGHSEMRGTIIAEVPA